jgi:hypothetical protein
MTLRKMSEPTMRPVFDRTVEYPCAETSSYAAQRPISFMRDRGCGEQGDPMRRFRAVLAMALVFLMPAVPDQAHAERKPPMCANRYKDVPVKNAVGSAGLWANLRDNPGSVKFESNAILELARGQAASVQRPEGFCPKGCSVAESGFFVLQSHPKKTRKDAPDATYCAALERSTLGKPLLYRKTDVRTIDDLNGWIGDLSQGSGPDGNDLYAKCDRSCSPRFDYFISRNDPSGTQYTVEARVVCGAPRDKDDNRYQLRSFFRWYCA